MKTNASGTREGQPGTLVKDLMQVQFDLYAYIVVLLGDTQEAYDILQETNQQVIQIEGERQGIVHFLAWAKRIAYFQVCTWRTKQRRERLVFDDEVFERVAGAAADTERPANERIHALNECMKKLPEKLRELFMARHIDGVSVRELAAREGRSSDGLSVTLHRTRQALRACIRKRLVLEQSHV
jgi:RNA polymerase sigma-70 factor (ECF subfamily)